VPYPLSLRGTAFSELDDVEATLVRIEESLRAGKARGLKREGDAIRFKGSFLGGRFSRSVLKVISWGVIRVSRVEGRVQAEYELHFLQNHLARGVVSGAAFGAIYFGVRTADPTTTVVASVAFWVLMASLDYLMAASIFPRYLASKLTISGSDSG
jgi:hypothetical protein